MYVSFVTDRYKDMINGMWHEQAYSIFKGPGGAVQLIGTPEGCMTWACAVMMRAYANQVLTDGIYIHKHRYSLKPVPNYWKPLLSMV